MSMGSDWTEGEPMTGAKMLLPWSMPVQLYGPPAHAPSLQPGLRVHLGSRPPRGSALHRGLRTHKRRRRERLYRRLDRERFAPDSAANLGGHVEGDVPPGGGLRPRKGEQ